MILYNCEAEALSISVRPGNGPRVVESFRGPKFCREVRKYYPEAKGGYVRLLISPVQSNQDIDVGFWLSTLRSTSCSPA
ncbi:hypothetical protein F2Q69_00007257 [Brassica cretica]|uniref:Uncharacterized protein n=1 Tax=Brassica cretica TaxID=69181 RepID=A0A8S9PCC8_BRACR|nr:hypothetical protein F2Q69_00007257 [Brassica cretica]